MPYSYTNRHGKTHYFRAAETKKGKYRYYVTISDQYPNLIDRLPEGFEVAELPEDAKVVIRKRKSIGTSSEEREIVEDIIRKYSAIKDFFIYAEENYLYVYHSQFNYAGGQDTNLNREEAIEHYGKGIEQWMRFSSALRFQLVDTENRLFQAERVVYLNFFASEFFLIGEPGFIENLTKAYGQHLGKDSFFDIAPHGWQE